MAGQVISRTPRSPTVITGRFTCGQCGAVYHDQTKPTKVAGTCDECGGHDMKRRADDNEETIRERMNVYDAQTAPLLEYYRSRGLLREVDGMGSVEAVSEALSGALSA